MALGDEFDAFLADDTIFDNKSHYQLLFEPHL
jgi:hypothetical protein